MTGYFETKGLIVVLSYYVGIGKGKNRHCVLTKKARRETQIEITDCSTGIQTTRKPKKRNRSTGIEREREVERRTDTEDKIKDKQSKNSHSLAVPTRQHDKAKESKKKKKRKRKYTTHYTLSRSFDPANAGLNVVDTRTSARERWYAVDALYFVPGGGEGEGEDEWKLEPGVRGPLVLALVLLWWRASFRPVYESYGASRSRSWCSEEE